MKKHLKQESGIALIVVMLVMVVLTVMLIGFYFVTSGEQKIAASNRDNSATYYAAIAGLEQMSNAIADYFAHTASPTPTQITNWTSNASNYQTILGTNFTYTLYCTAPLTPGPCNGIPVLALCSTVGGVLGSCSGTIGGNGALSGLQGIITPFMLQVTASGPSTTEVKLSRTVQEVAVPIFEFGIFSDSDLSFHAGANFSFGGRVHTNGNLFLAEDGGSTLLLNDHVTAAKDVIRAQLSNGYVIQSGGPYGYTVDVLTGSGGCPPPPPVPTGSACRALSITEGSVTGGPGSAVNTNWQSLSTSTYNGFIQNGKTGAKVLNLAISLPGINSQPIAMLQRGPAGESPTSALGIARFYNMASVRILLSDTQADIMSLPGIDSTEQPYPLAEFGSASTSMPYTVQRTTSIPATYCPPSSNCYVPPIDACHPPLAESVGSAADSDYMTAAGTPLLGGYIKIEMNLAATPGTWKDVTEEFLAQGISRDIASGAADTAPAATLATASGGSLSASKTYYYVVTALGAWGESAGTQASKTTTSSYKKITVTLPTVTGATGYNVYRTTTAGTYTGTGNGVITLAVGTAQTGWASSWTSYTDSGATTPTSISGPPSPCVNTSIIHLQEAAPGVSFSGWTASGLSNASDPTKFVPINMYDSREGELRDSVSRTLTTSSLNGIINLLEVDVGNLQQWFAGNIATNGQYVWNGPDALNNSGYILYTSDRRMNCMDGSYGLEGTCTSNAYNGSLPTAGETGEFGNEDIINPSAAAGAPNLTLDPPEDVAGDGVFRTYGAYAHPIAAPSATVTPTGTTPTGTWNAIITGVSNSATANPAEVRFTNTQAQKNSVVIFRRALRLVNGTLGNLPPLAAAQANPCSGGSAGGFSVASENPIYVLGDYNASVANGFNDAAPLCHVPAAVMGDAVTLLSNNWTPGAQSGFPSGDANSFAYPTYPNCNNGNPPIQRCASTSYYRMAVMAGKTIPFAKPSWGANDTGTDGGVHNFLRYVEDWGGYTLNYLGSLSSFYISRQGTGIYKYSFNDVVYDPPTRNYTFDTDFQSIGKLPPGTPRFTDVNALSAYQSILPSQ